MSTDHSYYGYTETSSDSSIQCPCGNRIYCSGHAISVKCSCGIVTPRPEDPTPPQIVYVDEPIAQTEEPMEYFATNIATGNTGSFYYVPAAMNTYNHQSYGNFDQHAAQIIGNLFPGGATYSNGRFERPFASYY